MDNQNKQVNKYIQLIYKLPICHRLPDRTFNISGHYLPVCARCTGFYIGDFSCVYFFYVQYTTNIILLAFLMIITTFIDGLNQIFGFIKSYNMLRSSTGLLGGLGLLF